MTEKNEPFEERKPAPEEAPAGEEQKVNAIYYEAPPEDTEVIGVRFRTSGKVYYFDPEGVKYPEGCHAVVETARGLEYGLVTQTNHIVAGKDIVLPLRKALRVATKEDDKHEKENEIKAEEAFKIGNKKIEEHGLDMKLLDTEYTFDNSKLLFYFTSDGRVDFRDLVKDLATVFRCRIELRQMGIRDEAKVLGGLAACGRPFCCHAFLPDFVQVSIKMAKEQNLSLNAAKISGACGRLMCCLRYEYDTYVEEGRLTPKVDTLVNTPDGIGVVVEAKPLVGLVKVKSLDDNAGAPKVYHRDLLSPIKKGDDNYEKAQEEKALEKQAKAAGTTRAALKAAARGETPPDKKEERPQRPMPQRAASYTGQVMPSALESAPAVKTSEEKQPDRPAEKKERQDHRDRGRGRRGGRPQGKGQGQKKEAPAVSGREQSSEARVQNRPKQNPDRPRYEKVVHGSHPGSENRDRPAAEKPAAEKSFAPASQEKKHKQHRPFRPFKKKGDGKSDKQ